MRNITNQPTRHAGQTTVTKTETSTIGKHHVSVGESPTPHTRHSMITTRHHDSTILPPHERTTSSPFLLGTHALSLPEQTAPPRLSAHPYLVRTTTTKTKITDPAHSQTTTVRRNTATTTTVDHRQPTTLQNTAPVPYQSAVHRSRPTIVHSLTENVAALHAPMSSPVGVAAKMASVQEIALCLTEVVHSAGIPPLSPLTAHTTQLAHTLAAAQDTPQKTELLRAATATTATLSNVVSTLTTAIPTTPRTTIARMTASAQQLTHILTAAQEAQDIENKAALLSAAKETTATLSTVVSTLTTTIPTTSRTTIAQMTASAQQLTHTLTAAQETKNTSHKAEFLSAAKETLSALGTVLSTITDASPPTSLDPLTSSAEQLTRILIDTQPSPNKQDLLAAARETTTALGNVIATLTDAVEKDALSIRQGNTQQLIALFENGPPQPTPAAQRTPEIPPGNTATKRALLLDTAPQAAFRQPGTTRTTRTSTRTEDTKENRTPGNTTETSTSVTEQYFDVSPPSSPVSPTDSWPEPPPPVSNEMEPEPIGTPSDILAGYTMKRSVKYGVTIAYASPAEEQSILNTLAVMSQLPEGQTLLQQLRDGELILVSTQSLLEKNRLSITDLKDNGGILHRVFEHPDPAQQNTHVFVLDCEVTRTQTSLRPLLNLLAEELSLINQATMPETSPFFQSSQRIRALQQELYLLEATWMKNGQSTQSIQATKGLLTDIKRELLASQTAINQQEPPPVQIKTIGGWLNTVEQQARDIFSQQTEATNRAMQILQQALARQP